MSVPQQAVVASVIVVNYNGIETIAACLDSVCVSSGAGIEVIVVDNASTDGSRQVIERFADRGIVAIFNQENRGYAAAINQGVAQANGEFIAVCNMDVVVREGWLDPLIDWLRRHPDTGAVNPLLLLTDGRVNASGQDIHVTGLGFNRALGAAVSRIPTEPFEVSGIQGAAFVTRRATLLSVGGIDPAGFLYHEDVNLSWLLRLAGYDLWCIPASRAVHDYALSMHPFKFYLLERNRVAMLLTYLRRSTLVALFPALFVTEMMTWMYSLLKGIRFAAAKLDSYRSVWKQRDRLRQRRAYVETVRRKSDWSVLRALRWKYDWSQFFTLARETGTIRRPRIDGPPER